MDTKTIEAVLATIAAERDRRLERFREADPESADAQWTFRDGPLVAELCLMLLVVVRHQVERELITAAALLEAKQAQISHTEFERLVQQERQRLRGKDKTGKRGWKGLSRRLRLRNYREWDKEMEILRLIANSYKHHPVSGPDEDLLNHLQLDTSANYAPLAESEAVRRAVATQLGLPNEAGYCEIARELISVSNKFLRKVLSQPRLSSIKRRPVSFKPTDFLQ